MSAAMPDGAESDNGMTVAEFVRARLSELRPNERRVAQVLLADYPSAGLLPVAQVAARAGVSSPSVMRFATRLGLVGWPGLQERPRAELRERTASASWQFLRIPERAITDASRRVWTLGGRFSSVLARNLAIHLQAVRAGVYDLVDPGLARRAPLVDMGRRDVLGLLDYRRYQNDVVEIGTTAASQGASLVLFTDPWLSPLAPHAHAVLTAEVKSPSPFNAMTPAMAVMLTLIAAVVDRLGAHGQQRLIRIEDDPAPSQDHAPPPPGPTKLRMGDSESSKLGFGELRMGT